jgi:hypothetical protein
MSYQLTEGNLTNPTLTVPLPHVRAVGYLHIPEGRRDHTTPPRPCAVPELAQWL